MTLQNIYESGRTIRYHANPQMGHLNQTVADHTWGMLAMLFYLNPEPSLNLIQAITFHDSSERWIGDIPFPFKKEAPDLAHHHDMVGQTIALKKGVPCRVPLTVEEEEWLKLLDRLEAYQFAKLHGKLGPDWKANNDAVFQSAQNLGCHNKVMEAFNGRCT